MMRINFQANIMIILIMLVVLVSKIGAMDDPNKQVERIVQNVDGKEIIAVQYKSNESEIPQEEINQENIAKMNSNEYIFKPNELSKIKNELADKSENKIVNIEEMQYGFDDPNEKIYEHTLYFVQEYNDKNAYKYILVWWFNVIVTALTAIFSDWEVTVATIFILLALDVCIDVLVSGGTQAWRQLRFKKTHASLLKNQIDPRPNKF